MQDNDLLQLRKEIALRGRIIETIVSGNEELRGKYMALVSFLQSKAETYSPAEKEMLEKITGNTVHGKGKGITEPSYSLTENAKAYPELSYSNVEKEKGITKSSYSFIENVKASPEFNYSIPEKEKGITEIGYSVTEKENASPESGYSLTGNDKGITDDRNRVTGTGKVTHTPEFAFRVNVKSHLKHKGRRSTLDATTALLKHIYDGGDCGYPTLKKVTHLSTGGLGKRLMSLTKRGLIKRTGLQKLALTESALNLLRHAYDGSAKH
ncbi:MAG: hypothetical protein V4615_11345 [Bacteroidota bacterium]